MTLLNYFDNSFIDVSIKGFMRYASIRRGYVVYFPGSMAFSRKCESLQFSDVSLSFDHLSGSDICSGALR